jgi:hypothetical protein
MQVAILEWSFTEWSTELIRFDCPKIGGGRGPSRGVSPAEDTDYFSTHISAVCLHAFLRFLM